MKIIKTDDISVSQRLQLEINSWNGSTIREHIMEKFLRSLRVFRLIKVWQIGLLALVLFGVWWWWNRIRKN